ncbi:MAG: hypothetical protein MUF06_14760 [Pirellulaceae bacterium]|nr:hypothetical protein [Pirellulaceae bacterium]
MARSATQLLASIGLLLVTGFAWGAAPPSENLLPISTKAFVSTNNVEELRAKFRETQLGQLVNDPVMKEFIDDAKSQIGAKLEKAGKRMGLKWADMEGVSSGEVALGLIQPDIKDKTSHATVIIVDITGNRQQADALLKKVDANQAANKAVRSTLKLAGVEATVYTLPLAAGEKVAEKSLYFIKNEVLVVADDEKVAAEIAKRFDAKDLAGTLASLTAFKAAMDRNKKAAAGVQENLRWFIEPFGYAEVSRAMQGGRRRRGTDLVKTLREQGFGAAQGLGGYVFFSTGNEDILHRSFVYAPPAAGATGKDKYQLAMRMLDFPNAPGRPALHPQDWAMADVASYLTLNWNIKDAFEHSKTLVDAIAGEEGLFDEIWLSMKVDPNGPMIDIRKELVNLLGTRVTVMSDVKLPVDLKSERLMVLVDVNNPAVVAKTLEKAFKADPAAKKRVIGTQVIWELTQDEGLAEDTELKIEGVGFTSVAEEEAGADDEGPAIPNMALTVFEGHLIVASHVEFITEFIEKVERSKAEKAKGNDVSLGATPDFVRVDAALVRLGSASDSFRFFTRTEKAYRATYDLVKENKLPEAETLAARLINGLASAKEGREPAIDGTKLPAFGQISKYLGPGGFYVQTEDDGWFIVGCLLAK